MALTANTAIPFLLKGIHIFMELRMAPERDWDGGLPESFAPTPVGKIIVSMETSEATRLDAAQVPAR